MPLPFFFEGRIARTSLVGIDTALSGAETLESWCALVVHPGAVFADGRILASRGTRIRRRVKRWKYAVFLPSALLPAGVFYLQMRLFNEFPNFEFRTITVWLAVLLPAAGIAVSELARLLRRDRETRILSVLHVEWVLILGAIFLPVAANARLIPAAGDENHFDSLCVFGLLAVPVFLSMIFFTVYLTYQRKKCHVHRHPNS